MLKRSIIISIILLMSGMVRLLAAPPKIDFIEPFMTDLVLIHFDMEANLYYQVQYTETLTNGVPGGNWTNLLNEPAFSPFPSHFVAVDTRLRPQRFYRLYVYP